MFLGVSWIAWAVVIILVALALVIWRDERKFRARRRMGLVEIGPYTSHHDHVHISTTEEDK